MSSKILHGLILRNFKEIYGGICQEQNKNASKWPACIKLLLQMGRLDSSTSLLMCIEDKKVNVSEIEWYGQNNVTK